MPAIANIRTVESPHALAPAGPLSEDELSWANRLVLCGNLGWHLVGRDEHGHLVAATTVSCGQGAPHVERYCTITRTSTGLVCASTRRPVAQPHSASRAPRHDAA